jgi:hypothetical protein
MAARGGPPDGIPGGGNDGEDEYGSVVFDESFVRAAGLHEPTARERMHAGEKPRPLRPPTAARTWSGRALTATLLVIVLVASVLFFALRSLLPGPPVGSRTPAVLSRTVLEAAAGAPVTPAGPPADPFAGSPAAAWPDGAAGIHLPEAAATAHFTVPQVQSALLSAREIVSSTQTAAPVLRGAHPWVAEALLDPAHRRQLITAIDHPADDDVHAATGWVTRFDPATVEQFDPRVRVDARVQVTERSENDLSVVVDGVFVYAVRQVGANPAPWTRFVVHRTWDFHADHEGLRHGLVGVRSIITSAGPQACAADGAAWFRPTFPGNQGPPATTAPTDPYRLDPSAVGPARCGMFGGTP